MAAVGEQPQVYGKLMTAWYHDVSSGKLSERTATGNKDAVLLRLRLAVADAPSVADHLVPAVAVHRMIAAAFFPPGGDSGGCGGDGDAPATTSPDGDIVVIDGDDAPPAAAGGESEGAGAGAGAGASAEGVGSDAAGGTTTDAPRAGAGAPPPSCSDSDAALARRLAEEEQAAAAAARAAATPATERAAKWGTCPQVTATDPMGVSAPAVPCVTLDVVNTDGEDLHEVLSDLVHVLYHAGRCASAHPAVGNLCIMVQVVAASMAPAFRGDMLTALSAQLTAAAPTSVPAKWFTFLTSDDCPIPLDPTLTENFNKCRVAADLQALKGWPCPTCAARTPRDQTVCVVCRTPLGVPTDTPALVRMPSDMDAAFFVPPPAELAEFEKLKPCQRTAVEYVVATAQRASNERLGGLQTRLQGLGYTFSDLRKCLRYLRDEAPIILHVNLGKALGFLARDTHYRNQFETGTSGGALSRSSRVQWEDRLFNNAYHDAQDTERVKYGVLNITNDPHGVRACSQYGESYMVMKNVRLRTTFADMDSSSPSTSLATCEYHNHVLMQYNDAELTAVMEVATGKASWRPSACISQYKEVQFHGEVKLSEHVEALVVGNMHRGDPVVEGQLADFAAKHSIPIVWMAETAQDAANRHAREAARAAERARLEALKWTCWGCEARNEGDAGSCPVCGTAKPVTPIPASVASYCRWECSACSSSNAGDQMKCSSCSAMAPAWTCPRCSAKNPNCNVVCELCRLDRPAPGATFEAWMCKACTSENPGFNTKCSVCETAKPEGPSTPARAWICTFCTMTNEATVLACTVCGNPRAADAALVEPADGEEPDTSTPTPAAGVAAPAPVTAAPAAAAPTEPWSCLECTLVNAAGVVVCGACGAASPAPAAAATLDDAGVAAPAPAPAPAAPVPAEDDAAAEAAAAVPAPDASLSTADAAAPVPAGADPPAPPASTGAGAGAGAADGTTAAASDMAPPSPKRRAMSGGDGVVADPAAELAADRPVAVTFHRVACPNADGSGSHVVAYRDWQSTNPRADLLPVVCFHGLTRNGSDFNALAKYLCSRGYRVIAVDVVGRGHSDYLDNASLYGYPQYVADAAHLLATHLGFTAVHWIGTSMGGLMGMMLAAQPSPPLELRTLVLNDVGPFVPKAAMARIASYVGVAKTFDSVGDAEAYIRKNYSGFGPSTPELWQELAVNSVTTVKPDSPGGAMKYRLSYDVRIGEVFAGVEPADVDLWAMFEAVKCGRLFVLRGASSDLLLPDVAERMQTCVLPGVKSRGMVVVDGAGHVPTLADDFQIQAVADALEPASGSTEA